ncbi:MAG: MFS transporter [Sphingopyxis sp.]|nr:MFS transporter [Sphingopyxis sp.]
MTPPHPGAGTGTAAPASSPDHRVGWPWIAALSGANFGLWVALFGPIQLLLALQAQAIAPDNKLAVLGIVTAVGAACSLVANPLFGALSDRTTSRFGRRLPWLAFGMVGGTLGLFLLATADSVAMMTLGWGLTQTTLNAMFAAIVATIPDQVPVSQRGSTGAWLGLAQTAGVVGGVAVAEATSPDIALGYIACAAVMVAAALPFLAMRRDVRLHETPPPIAWQSFLSNFWIDPRQNPDVAWAWLTRLLFNLVYSLGTLYLLYYLGDVLRRENPAGDVLTLTALNVGVLMLVMIPAGSWSDRIQRRRGFAIVAGILLAGGALIFALWPSWPNAMLGAAILGAGFGIYTAVDVAIVTAVLPDASGHGRDLGILNIANSLPQVFAPALASFVVSFGGYAMLYALAAVFALLASGAVRRIKSVR